MQKFVLKVNQIDLMVNLGVSQQERSRKQLVFVAIELEFNKMPSACITDDIANTICYHNLAKTLNEYISGKEFNLIEYLAHKLLNIVKDVVKGKDVSQISLVLSKPNPPTNYIQGGVSFEIKENVNA